MSGARESSGDKRESSGFGAAALGAVTAASMVGAGVWTTSGYVLAALGTPGRALLVWLLGGAVALCGAAAYGGLVRRFPGGGGEYLFLARAVHPLAGFLAGWVSLWAGFTGAAALAALALAEYAGPWLPAAAAGLPPGALGAAVVLLCGALHAAGRAAGGGAQTAAVGVKLALIAAFCGFAAVQFARGRFAGGPVFAPPPPDAPAGSALAAAVCGQLVWVSLSYSGFNAAIYLAGEARDPGRTAPRAMLWATGLVTLLYLALNATFVLAPPAAAASGAGDVAAVAARAIGGGRLEAAVRAVICLGLLTSVSALVQTGPRVYAAMAADGLFPAPGAFRTRPDGSAPPAAVLAQAALAAAACLAGTLTGLLEYLGLTLSVTAAAAACCTFAPARRGAGPGGEAGGEATRRPVAAWRRGCAAGFAAATLGVAAVGAAADPGAPLLAAAVTAATGTAAYALLRPTAPPAPSAAPPHHDSPPRTGTPPAVSPPPPGG